MEEIKGENCKKDAIKQYIYDLYAADNQVPPHDVKIDQTAERIIIHLTSEVKDGNN